jgi:predicted transposase YdaD
MKCAVWQVFRVIDFIMALPNELEDEFWAEVDQIEVENKMPYISSVERIGIKKGIEIGRQEGRQEGLLLAKIAQTLDSKFGSAGRELMPKVEMLTNLDALQRFVQLLNSAPTVDVLRDYFN